MNLTTDPWIPVVWGNGSRTLASLSEAFARGERIRDLAVRPHERISLMRLLLCVAQAALDGPADHDEWAGCRAGIQSRVPDYLGRWRTSFELFGAEERFLQIPRLERVKEDAEGSALSKLDFALASGNNSTLFDNSGGEVREFSHARLALNLLTFQCFSPGGRIGVALREGKETAGRGSSEHAPCLAGGAHALLRGADLQESIHLNLLTRSHVEQLYGSRKWGKPMWEEAEGTETYLGRLVPLSRAIRIEENGSMVLANGLKYPPFPQWREPTSTVRAVKGGTDRALVRCSLDRAPWRELHAITVREVSRDNGGPLALQNVRGDRPFDLWVGGLVSDQAKLIDTLESVYHVPATMLNSGPQRAYEAGVKHAESTEMRLRRAIVGYQKGLGNNLDRAEMQEQRKRIQAKAVVRFWTDVERLVPRLLETAVGEMEPGPESEWGKAVWRRALEAYDHACAHETARQIRAHALGRRVLTQSHVVKAEEE